MTHTRERLTVLAERVDDVATLHPTYSAERIALTLGLPLGTVTREIARIERSQP